MILWLWNPQEATVFPKQFFPGGTSVFFCMTGSILAVNTHLLSYCQRPKLLRPTSLEAAQDFVLRVAWFEGWPEGHIAMTVLLFLLVLKLREAFVAAMLRLAEFHPLWITIFVLLLFRDQ